MTPTRPIDASMAELVEKMQSTAMAIAGDRLDTGILGLRRIRTISMELEKRLIVQQLAAGAIPPEPEHLTQKPALAASWRAGVEAAQIGQPKIYKHESYDQTRPFARAFHEGYEAAEEAKIIARRRPIPTDAQ